MRDSSNKPAEKQHRDVKRKILIVSIPCILIFGSLFLLGRYYSNTQIHVKQKQATPTNVVEVNGSMENKDDVQEKKTEEAPANTVLASTQAMHRIKNRNVVTEYLDNEVLPTSFSNDDPLSVDIKEGSYILFFVLDDAGASLMQVQPYLDFEGRITMAVLPHLRQTHEVAQELQVHDIPYILHLPMEPLGVQNPGAHAVRVLFSTDKIEDIVHSNIRSISGIIGVNNHMGSLATSNRRVMRIVLKILKEKRLFFLDSKTTAHSVVREVGMELGVQTIVRDVFIDNESNVEAIQAQIRKGIIIAKNRGYAVLLGHVTKLETFLAISQLYPLIKNEGGILAGLDEYFHYVSAPKVVMTREGKEEFDN